MNLAGVLAGGTEGRRVRRRVDGGGRVAGGRGGERRLCFFVVCRVDLPQTELGGSDSLGGAK